MTIYKYPLLVTDAQTVRMPGGAKLLSVQTQNGTPCLWALVDPRGENVSRALVFRGTGQPITAVSIGQFVGTVQLHEGSLVLHLFDLGER